MFPHRFAPVEALPAKPESPRTKPLLITKDRHLLQGKFLKDAAGFCGKPEGMAVPSSEAQVVTLLEKANHDRIPLVVVGGGTALTGAGIAHKGIVVSTDRLNRFLRIKKRQDGSGVAVIEPGVPLGEFLNKVKEKKLFYLPGPTDKRAFFGGMVNTNAAGAPSFRYGRTGTWVQRLRVVLPIPNRKGDISVLDLERGRHVSNRKGEFEILLLGGERLVIPPRTYSFPPVKHAGGYASGSSLDLIDLFIGSEGTLGIVTEIELSLLDRKGKEDLLSGFAFFPTVDHALAFIRHIRHSPFHALRTLEFFDRNALRFLKNFYPEIPGRGEAALFFEEEIPSERERERREGWVQLLRRYSVFPESGGASWFAGCADKETHERFQEYRHALPVQVNALMGRRGYRKIGTDFVIPEKLFESFTRGLLQTLDHSKIPFLLWVHAGDCNYHINFLPGKKSQVRQALLLKGRIARNVLLKKGSLSGEHGFGEVRLDWDGRKRFLAELHFGRRALLQMAETKLALDPHLILNPGKVIPMKWLQEAKRGKR
ncbi:MAG: FAD-binding oxidoreductase [Candidatus Omnitrophica bacterium]|nr:FAD-binding oxidoreductase [Candidatus Omnitrophota bacterium]